MRPSLTPLLGHPLKLEAWQCPGVQSSTVYPSPPKKTLTSGGISFHSQQLSAISPSGTREALRRASACVSPASAPGLPVRFAPGTRAARSQKAPGRGGVVYLAVDHGVFSVEDHFPRSRHQQGFRQHGSWHSCSYRDPSAWDLKQPRHSSIPEFRDRKSVV